MKNNETHLQDSTKKETMYITSLPERAIFWTICLFILILLGTVLLKTFLKNIMIWRFSLI